MTRKPTLANPAKAAAQSAREARLAAALRANLKRRKAAPRGEEDREAKNPAKPGKP